MLSPAETRCASPSMVKLPVPSSTVTSASPSAVCVLISSSCSKAKSVMLRARFCASVLLTICPGRYSTSSPRRSTCAFSMFFRPMIRSPLFLTVEILPAVRRSYTFVQLSRPGTCGRVAKLSASCASVGMKSRISPLWNFS